MSVRGRLALLAVGGTVLALLLALSVWHLPRFGSPYHPYGEQAVRSAEGQQKTANAVMSLTFDQRGTDTFGEEIMLFASALGAAVLLRRGRDEVEDGVEDDDAAQSSPERGPGDDAVQVMGWLLLPVAMLVGLYVVAHGHVSPGGGFQGGVMLASALHLVYLAGSYPALERIRPEQLYELADAAGALAYAVLGLAVMVTGSTFLANVLPKGQLTSLVSAGTVPVLNVAVGVEVGAAFVLLLAEFFDQTLAVGSRAGAAGDVGGAA